MKDYIAVRKECEALLGRSGLPHTILRPWYVLGPGHRWPLLLKPICRRLGLVTIDEMVLALAEAVETGAPRGKEVWEVPKKRDTGRQRDAYATTGNVRNRGRSEGSAV